MQPEMEMKLGERKRHLGVHTDGRRWRRERETGGVGCGARGAMCSATMSFPTMALNFGDCPFSTIQFQLKGIVAERGPKNVRKTAGNGSLGN